MFVCPVCNNKLKQNTHSYNCNKCGYKADTHNEIVFFHPDIDQHSDDYRPRYLDLLYKQENKHFWFSHRRKVILSAFNRHVKKEAKILEIGAGTGNVARMLLQNGYPHISIGDIHSNGLEYAKTYGIHTLYQFDVTHTPFSNHFDVVGLFDVLEHIDDDNSVVKNLYRMLLPKGKCIVTVPAHQWLWSNIDFNSDHKRRYEVSGLKSLFENNGFKIVHAYHFFYLILPFLLLRKILNTHQSVNEKIIETNSGIAIHHGVNHLFYAITYGERLLPDFHPNIGGSILLVAEK